MSACGPDMMLKVLESTAYYNEHIFPIKDTGIICVSTSQNLSMACIKLKSKGPLFDPVKLV